MIKKETGPWRVWRESNRSFMGRKKITLIACCKTGKQADTLCTLLNRFGVKKSYSYYLTVPGQAAWDVLISV